MDLRKGKPRKWLDGIDEFLKKTEMTSLKNIRCELMYGCDGSKNGFQGYKAMDRHSE